MHWIIEAVCVFLISFMLAGIIIPQILLISFRRKLFDEPNGRKIHTSAVPRLGGIAFMPSILFALALVAGIGLLVEQSHTADPVGPTSGMSTDTLAYDSFTIMGAPLCFGLCALIIMYLVGIADDLIGVKYRAKFTAQILSGFLLAASGLRLGNLYGFMGIYELPSVISWGLTILVTVFITNAINLIDGIDGLASGLSGIAMGFYGVAFLLLEQPFYSMLAFAGLGTLVPFFYYNVFCSPGSGKKIFMGDTGALTTGMILSFLFIAMVQYGDSAIIGCDTVVAAFAPLVIPCLDVVRVFFHRIIRGHSPFLPDKTHIHHKLLAIGIRQRYAMIIILTASAALIVMNLWLSTLISSFLIALLDLSLWVISNYWLTRSIRSRQERLNITEGYV